MKNEQCLMNTIKLGLAYVENPIDFYKQHKSDSNSLLLMTAEIDSKKAQKSIMILKSAVKIEAYSDKIKLIALSSNGEELIDACYECSLNEYKCSLDRGTLIINNNFEDDLMDEDQRLKSTTHLSPIRSIIKSIKCLEDQNDLFIGGNFSFDLLETYEKLPKVEKSETSCPLYCLYVAEILVEVDHQNHSSIIKGHVFGKHGTKNSFFEISKKINSIKTKNIETKVQIDPLKEELETTVNISDKAFKDHVKKIKEKIIDGDIFQAVLSRTFQVPCKDPISSFKNLVKINPGPYMFYMEDDNFTLFGSSPESALKYCSKSNSVEIYPIAGTRKRGKNKDLDGRIELELRTNEKEVAEHMMLVDLARNDISKVSQTASTYVSPLMKVDRYQRVMHLVSKVQGKLRSDLDALHAYQATMNMGTLTGAPKVSAATIVRNIEKKERGPYGGAVGYINGSGDMDTCIVIRSAFIKDSYAYVQAGAGIVYDSDPEEETQETKDKAYSVIKALGGKI